MVCHIPETMAPRIALGAISDMYRTMTAETKPIPIPAMRRPGTRTAIVVEATWRTTPSEKTPHPAMIVERRPIQSARDPANSAPKKVPADKIDTINDCWEVVYRRPLKASLSVDGPV